MNRITVLICGAVLALSVPALGQNHADADAAIRAGSQNWATAWNAADAAALAALYAEDAIVMAPGEEPAQGAAAIEKHFLRGLEASPGSLNKIETLEVMASGDWAVEVGRFVVDSKEGKHLDHGRYVAVWKKVDGNWMLYRDIWNSSMPQ